MTQTKEVAFLVDTLADSRLAFEGNPGFACLVVHRGDGHDLSLSMCQKSLIHFDKAGNVVTDYGSFTSTREYLTAIAEFLA